MNAKSIHTFLAANTPDGFKSVFEPFLTGKTAYIVKGGPGTGKSGLMKKVAAEAVRRGEFTEYIHCSSDPDSLDGVFIPSKNTAVCDGTAPHTLDPKYPGAAGGIINLGRFWNTRILTANRSGIISLSSEISSCYAEAYRYLGAAGYAAQAIRCYAGAYIDRTKLNTFIRRFIKKNIRPKAADSGKIFKRFLSAYSPKGYITFTDTLYALADKVFAVKDKYYMSDILITPLFEAAIRGGYDAYAFYNPLMPDKIMHMAVPELGIAIATFGQGADTGEAAQTINMSRFTEKEIFLDAEKIRFSRRIFALGHKGALKAIARAKAIHDDLEDIYIGAMNFEEVNEETKNITKTIFE